MKKVILLFWLVLLLIVTKPLPLKAQCDILNKDYSNLNGWTNVGTAVTITSGKVIYNQIPGQSDHRVYTSLGMTLGNVWVAEFDFNPQSGNNIGVAASLFCLTAGTQKPYKDPPYTPLTPYTNQDFIEVNLVSPHNTPNYLSETKIYATYKDNASAPVSSSSLSIPAWNQTYYARIQRVSSTQGFLSVFSDQERTVHILGSPLCFELPASVNGLNTLQHANIDQADADRRFSGWVDNSCIRSDGTTTNPYNVEFNINDTYCYGESLVTSTKAPFVNNQWNFYECDINCNIIGPELIYFTGNNISVPLVNTPFISGHYYLVKHGVWSNCSPWQEAIKCFQVLALPVANAGLDLQLCPSTNGTKKIGKKGEAINIYTWTPSNWLSSSTMATPTPTLPTNILPCVSQTYTLTVKNSITGCVAKDYNTVNLINQVPSVTILTTPCNWCISPLLTASITGNCNNSIFWSPGGETTNTINTSSSALYTATTSNACFSATASTNVVFPSYTGSLPNLAITNAVTQNSPWVAFEYGKIAGFIPSYNANTYNLKIINQWGELIHEQSGNAACAGGFSNGEIAWNGICSSTGNYPPVDVFIYILTLTNCNSSRIYSGNLTYLLRISSVESEEIALPQNELQFSFYPNPTSDKITILVNQDTTFEDYQLEVVNVAGELTYSEKIETRENLILDIVNYPNGIYFVRLRSNISGKFKSLKMIVNHDG
ncbi:MAG: T9SS type A sorting domain-containing protein [Chitinophagaceae bacterium]|nr:T9SS type A sorting domain-containing protein [Chitinophagaceae bacterium]